MTPPSSGQEAALNPQPLPPGGGHPDPWLGLAFGNGHPQPWLALAAGPHPDPWRPAALTILAAVALAEAGRRAAELGLVVNIGHDLNLDNLPPLVAALPALHEASIGHELTADALDPRAVQAAVRSARPEVVVHQLSALRGTDSFEATTLKRASSCSGECFDSERTYTVFSSCADGGVAGSEPESVDAGESSSTSIDESDEPEL